MPRRLLVEVVELLPEGAVLPAGPGAFLVFDHNSKALAQGLDALTLPLDVSRDEEISAAFDFIRREWGSLDTIIMEDASQAVSSSEPGIYDIRSKSDKTSPLDGTRYSDW